MKDTKLHYRGTNGVPLVSRGVNRYETGLKRKYLRCGKISAVAGKYNCCEDQ